jgi:tetratricopeptide (TPR) repeat protein
MKRRDAPLALAMAGALFLVSCAPRVAPRLPEGEDYVLPAAAPGELSKDEARDLESAWRRIQAGDAAEAGRSLERLLARRPGLLPVETGLAYARLRAGRLDDAAALFDSVLARREDYVPALVGAGSTAFRRGDAEAAVRLYRRAQAAAPNDPLVRKRLAELKVQVADRRMALAQAAVEAGDDAAAAREYRAALEAAPEVAGVRLALADLLEQQGDPVGAVAALEGDPSGDRQVALRLARLLASQHEYARAGEVYRGLLTRNPADAEALAGERAAREGLELLTMAEEYRRIPEASRLSRADLAALLAVKVTALRRIGSHEPRVAVDIGGSWAREYVATVLALGVMDVYPNHTFQPGATVRRVDLARAVSRALEQLRWPIGGTTAPVDMPRSHLDYEAVTRALGAGLMTLAPGGAFEPWRPVTGREGMDVVEALARLVGP